MNFKVTASISAGTLAFISFLRVSLNYLVINYVSCFTFDKLVCAVAVETMRDSSPGEYTSLPAIEL